MIGVADESSPIEHCSVRDSRPPAPSRGVVAAGLLVSLWCIGFAAISVWFELTDHFATGEFAEHKTLFSVVNWLVAVLKLVGAAAAALAIRTRSIAPRTVGTVLWGAFATVTIYGLGSLGQALAIAVGIIGDADSIDIGAIAYVLAFLLVSAGFGILATSFARRNALDRRTAVIGFLGAPLLLGGVLVVVPGLLAAADLV